MSQRRGQTKDSSNNNTAQELVPFNESLDMPKSAQTMDRSGEDDLEAPLPPKVEGSLDERYEREAQNLKKKLWKENPFACGLTEPTWTDEYNKFKQNPMRRCSETAERDGVPCICCSAYACSMIGAGRVGHMAIIKQSTEWVEEVEDAGDGTEPTTRRYTRPRLDIVVGPVSSLHTVLLLCGIRCSCLCGTSHQIHTLSHYFLNITSYVSHTVLANALLCHISSDLWSFLRYISHGDPQMQLACDNIMGYMYVGADICFDNDGVSRSRDSTQVRTSSTSGRKWLVLVRSRVLLETTKRLF
jgi:hypothetical protein